METLMKEIILMENFMEKESMFGKQITTLMKESSRKDIYKEREFGKEVMETAMKDNIIRAWSMVMEFIDGKTAKFSRVNFSMATE